MKNVIEYSIRESTGKFAIGERNIIIATDTLAEERIPIVSSAVGGFNGRHLKFYTESGMVKKIRVLIVDDSAVVRQTLTNILLSCPEIEVMGCLQ